MDDFSKIGKIDVHAHIFSNNADFVALAKRDDFRFVNMCVWSQPDQKVNEQNHQLMLDLFSKEPNRTAPVGAFPLTAWDETDFQEQTIAWLDKLFEQGVVGVKVWKNIGMEFRDKNGKLVMIDDRKLDPIFEHIEQEGKVLLGHLGEPKNCWLPLEEMTTNNDRSYFSKNSKYHMYLHPEFPSYEDQIAARDRMLEKHPKINFVACHLASLEWNVDKIAEFLERFPNATVEVAARMGQVQYQSQRDRSRVREFFINYQDRILYGTDLSVRPEANVPERYESAKSRWIRDWRYFCTDQEQSVPELDDPVRGLKLPKSIVEKIYRENALRVFSKSWQDVSR